MNPGCFPSPYMVSLSSCGPAQAGGPGPASLPFLQSSVRPAAGSVLRGLAVAGVLSAAALGPVPAAAQEPPLVAAPLAPVVGIWQGALALPTGQSLTLVFHVAVDEEGDLRATLDSPDQGAEGIPVERAAFDDGVLSLDLPAIAARFEGRVQAPDSMTGAWSQGGAELPLSMTRVEEVRRPSRPQEPEPPFPYQEEAVRVPNPAADLHLAGTLTLPEGDGPFPAVALISGSGPQNRDSEVFGHRPFLVLADHLTRRGIAVLRSDDRGVGESEGDFATATSRDFATDAVAAAAYLRGRPEVNAEAVGLVGMSEGGLVAPMVAAEPGQVDFIVMLAGPGLPGEEILYLQGELIGRAMGSTEEQIRWNRELQARLFQVVKAEADDEERGRRLEEALRSTLDGLSADERTQLGIPAGGEDTWVRSQRSALGGPWFRYFLTHDPAPVLERVSVPVLALFGELDLQVPPDGNLEVVEAALRRGGNPDATVRELPSLNHLFQRATTGAPAEYGQIEETMSPEVMEMVARWILERAGSGGR